MAARPAQPASGWRWKKAGVRYTDAERRQLDLRKQIANEHPRQQIATTNRTAYRRWANGLMVPERITTALNRHSLYGPEFDEACGAYEPDVDMWEEGRLYPAWEQVQLLAKLTGFQPAFFMRQPSAIIPVEATSLRLHIPVPAIPTPPPVLRFSDEAVAAMQASLVEKYGHHGQQPADRIWCRRCPLRGNQPIHSKGGPHR